MAHICAREASIVEARSDQNGAAPQSSPSIALPHQLAHEVSCRVAIDIGGSLAKLVFFEPASEDGSTAAQTDGRNSGGSSHSGGTLQFVKFETSRMDEVLSFIQSHGLLKHDSNSGGGSLTEDGPVTSSADDDDSGQHNSHSARVLATGGGAFKYATRFQEQLGVTFEKADEMDCLVRGCNFLQTSVPREAFHFRKGAPTYLDKANGDVFPYLLVNIGSGVSIVKVSSASQAERVSGSALGGGTFAGLCRLLTGVKSFDEMLRLAAQGDNKKVDMLVGDIYGNRDYSKIKLSAETIASSFGKVVSGDSLGVLNAWHAIHVLVGARAVSCDCTLGTYLHNPQPAAPGQMEPQCIRTDLRPLTGNLDLDDCSPADIALSLCRMVSYNVAQIAYEVATSHGLQRVLFGGFFIRANAFTMETITFALDFWSKGRMAATFLRHEGFLGAVGAFVGDEAGS